MNTSFFALLILISCFSGQYGKQASRSVSTSAATTSLHYNPEPDPFIQISDYIPDILEDSNGNIWFGTNGEGVCRYDGKSMVFFTTKNGLGGNTVRAIAQGAGSDVLFATEGGVSIYDGKTFTTLSTKDGLCHNEVWSILRDRSGICWFGTKDGVSRYDGKQFSNFSIPAAKVDSIDAVPAPRLINSIIQDKAGNIWFGTNGGGAYRYNGKKLTRVSQRDGLSNNYVHCMVEDRDGQIWFGTRFGGVCCYDGRIYKSYEGDNAPLTVWSMTEDRTGNIWIGSPGNYLYKYDGKYFTHYTQADGIENRHVQSLMEDKKGNIWIGTSGGVYRFDGKGFSNFTRKSVGQ